MITELTRLAKDRQTKHLILLAGVAGGILLAVKSYYDLKLTRLRISELEKEIK